MTPAVVDPTPVDSPMRSPDHPDAAAGRCWSCQRAIDSTDRYCRGCGEGQGASLAWYYQPVWIVVLALTALGPFAVILIMRTPRLGRPAKWVLSLALVAFFAWVGWRLWTLGEALLEI